MTGQNVGQVELDLLLNSKGFKTQLEGAVNKAVSQTSASIGGKVSSSFGKMGKLALAAFSVKSLVRFTKSAIDLGSELQEVQNVVDSTFRTMSEHVDRFAVTAIKDFGLSEAKAKKYMGTMGAMAQSFGFTEREAFAMSKTLTGLVGDVASFYNLSSDEAYTKLKAVFTGETEALKDLGVVMTQAALDEFAMAKGYGASTAAMSEQQKVALRYAFIQEKLRTASGDFIRTQHGWANQMRILTLQWESFKAAMGQAFINILTPVIQMLNILISKLVIAAQAFKRFTDRIFNFNKGNKETEKTEGLATGTGHLSQNLGSASNNAKKLHKSLLSIDQLHILQDDPEIPDMGLGGGGAPDFDIDVDIDELEELNEETSKLIEFLKELKKAFLDGFKAGLQGNSLQQIKTELEEIKKVLKEILSDEKLQESAKNFLKHLMYSLGSLSGALESIAISLAEFFVGAILSFLERRKDDIKRDIADMFNVSTEITDTFAELFVTLSSVFKVFKEQVAKELGGSMLSVVHDIFSAFIKLCLRFLRDIINVLLKPIIRNKDKIEKALRSHLRMHAKIWGGIAKIIKFVADLLVKLYDIFFKPFFGDIEDGLTGVLGVFLDSVTVIQDLVSDTIDFCVNLWHVLTTAFSRFSEVIAKMINFFGDLMQYLKDTFSNGWKNTWESLTNFVKSMRDRIYNSWHSLMDWFSDVFSWIAGIGKRAWEAIKNSFFSVCDRMHDKWLSISNWFIDMWNWLKGIGVNIFNSMKDMIVNIFHGLSNALKWPFNKVISMVNSLISKLNRLHIRFPSWMGGGSFGFNIPYIPYLAQGGYVKPNTPQLAMIGDNKHEGEIVAPESKLVEAVTVGNQPLLKMIETLLSVLISQQGSGGDIVIPIYLDGDVIDEYIVEKNRSKIIRKGG